MKTWYTNNPKELLELPKGFRGIVFIPHTNDLFLIPVIRKTRLEIIQCDDPQEEYNKYMNTPKTNEDRLEFIKEQRGLYYKDLGIHPLALIGEEGMGYEWEEGWVEFPQRGDVEIGKNVRIGAFTSVKKGTINNTVISDGCKIGSHCNIGHNVKIGKDCLLTHRVSIGGSTEVGDNCIFWQGCLIANKLTIGRNCEIAMGAIVLKDVPDNTKVIGIWK